MMQSFHFNWIDYLDLAMWEAFYLQNVTGNRITCFTEEEWSALSGDFRKIRSDLEECIFNLL
ncbi:hypothetical protein SAMN04489760_110101 [Syntrophus gentianae]|uniref:Uncharacterized protein n=1 Tax=Syntrophus gentianae TaxID=43775 RepID=A0A1H7XGA7_9BACT|nr:hypothetical protein SAMN04489760_110101 [Syntrophus gentianae]